MTSNMKQKNRVRSGLNSDIKNNGDANNTSRINYDKPVSFTYGNKTYGGYEGDTVASALLANGVDIIGRSFKYSRPRGIVAAGAEEPNAILQMGATEATQVPNVRATQQELFDGLVCRATNGWPSEGFDLMSYVGKVGGNIMSPGFYYKTFMYPQKMWKTYEKVIRKAAGFGRSSMQSDPDIYDHIHRHCDVLIVGAGPSGLAAAATLAQTGARVIIADEQSEFGGSLLHSTELIDGENTQVWLAKVLDQLNVAANVVCLPRATVNGYHDHNFLTIHERRTDHISDQAPQHHARQRMHRVRAQWVVLATGAHERPLVFGNNDVPGSLLASAVSTYINRYDVVPGNRLVLMTTNDYAYQAALDWFDTGRKIVAIVDTRANPQGERIQKARDLGIEIITGTAVIDVSGSRRVSSVRIAALDAAGDNITGEVGELICDTVASSGGWSPAVHLSCHTGSRPIWNEQAIGFVPGETIQQQLTAGAINGNYSLKNCLQEGYEVACTAARKIGIKDLPEPNFKDVADIVETPTMALFHIPHTQATSRAPKQFVDLQNDVTAAGIEMATREGFESIEHVKRYTALGFGTDQGKLGNINGMAITAKALNKTIPETGTTIFRPNYTPISFGAIAGRHCGELFDPKRYTAMQRWHVDRGAEFEDVGQWQRPWYFPEAGETMQQTLNRECVATRESVGILDASTLGKIDIQGKDAREFLARVYTNAWAKLAVGKCRYGLMCGEDGMVFDDGVTSCLGENHFLMTTTTGGAARVLGWLELYHQTEWSDLDVYFTSVTDHWSTATISGPNSRKLLAELTNDINLENENFKFMDWHEGEVAGIPARVYRISFTGELSFEINVQANYGLFVWEQLIEKGKKFNITPYGTETMHILRAEKGFIIAGQDTDGSVHPYDLNMGWAVSANKPFSFIGKRGMAREDCVRPNRKQLVGLKTKDSKRVIPEGSQAVNDPNQSIPMDMQGHITSSYWSENLKCSIAMGFIKGGIKRMGESVYYPQADGTVIEAEICSSIFLDPAGDRQNV
jgi:sarcosine oxidase subunit alpha